MRLLLLTLIIASVLCGGCTPVISEQSRQLVDTDAPFSKIRETPENFIGKHLLLGGRIVQVRNNQSGAQLEIVQFEIDSFGVPLDTFRSYGRFIATTKEYIEPLIYRQGMLITLVGELKGKQTSRLDDMDYTYPVVAIRESYLLPDSAQNSGYQLPPHYDPYYYGYGYEPFLPRPFPLYLPR